MPESLFYATLLKKRLWHRCFPVNVVKFLRTPFLTNVSYRAPWWLFLKIEKVILVDLLRFFGKMFFKDSLRIMAESFKL